MRHKLFPKFHITQFFVDLYSSTNESFISYCPHQNIKFYENSQNVSKSYDKLFKEISKSFWN